MERRVSHVSIYIKTGCMHFDSTHFGSFCFCQHKKYQKEISKLSADVASMASSMTHVSTLASEKGI